MFNILKLTFIGSIFLIVQACSSPLMKNSDTNVVSPPGENTATIVFMRSSHVAGAVGVHIFEIADEELHFVGDLPNGKKVAYETTPGRKVFMTFGSVGDFMLAEVIEGKTYYSIIRPNWGTGGFAPTPIKSDDSTSYNMKGEEFNRWKNKTVLIEKNSNAKKWFNENKAQYNELYKAYWKKFQNKTAEEQTLRTLFPSDGI